MKERDIYAVMFENLHKRMDKLATKDDISELKTDIETVKKSVEGPVEFYNTSKSLGKLGMKVAGVITAILTIIGLVKGIPSKN